MKKCAYFSTFIIIAGLIAASSSRGQTYGLPKTGQTAVYHPAAGFDRGDDGAVLAGYPLSGYRFQDNGNGTVTDRATGLMWQKKCSASQSFAGVSGLVSWEEAFTYVAGMNYSNHGGYSDWRAPNIKELLSLTYVAALGPAGYFIFDSFQSGGYWSSTSYANYIWKWAFYVGFASGNIGSFDWTISTNRAYIKGVRSAYATPGITGFPKTGQTSVVHAAGGYDRGDDGATRCGYPTTGAGFTDNQDGTVVQNATGLVWQKTDSETKPIGDYSGTLTWEEAFSYIREMNEQAFAGYRDWRLPNYFETAGFFDHGWFYPCVHDLFRGTTQNDWYWTSTTVYGMGTTQAYGLHTGSGSSNFLLKSEKHYVRAVRGGAFPPPTPFVGFPTPTPGTAAVRGIPKTGQSASYHGTSSYDLGDDGAIQVGCPLVGNRFSATTNTVTDSGTDLVWQRRGSYSEGVGGLSGKLTWAQAFQYVAAMNQQAYGGFSDWRVPNIKELCSLLHLGLTSPSIDQAYFPETAQDFYWGSTTYADLINGQYVYLASFGEGNMEVLYINSSPAPRGYVRAVRGGLGGTGSWGFPKSGQCRIIHYPSGSDLGDDGAIQAGYPANESHFIDNGNGTVKDQATQLIWQKADSSLQSFGGYHDSLPWDSAFAYVAAMNAAGYAGYRSWRLPNYFELLSLVDYGQYSPAIDPAMKDWTRASLHWSSSSRNWQPGMYAWALNCINGFGTFFSKSDAYFVKAVIGGAGQYVPPTPPYPTPSPLPSSVTPATTPPWSTPTPERPPPTPLPLVYFGLPKTGQTIVYHSAEGNDRGDDGATQIGYPVSTARFVANIDGTVSDLATGLMWQEEDSYTQSSGGLSGPLTWSESFQYIAALNQSNFGGHNNWRIPNALELLSIRNLGAGQPIAYSIFPNTVNDLYWTSTGRIIDDGKRVFNVGFSIGQMLECDPDQANNQAYLKAVRTLYDGLTPLGFPRTGQVSSLHPGSGNDLGDDGAVRAGYPAYGGRFAAQQDGTVADSATGLTWQQADSHSQPFGGKQCTMTWAEAFQYVAGMNTAHFAGREDWRLPNQMELFSLIDYGRYNPAVDEAFRGVTQSALYWSSTSDHSNSSRAYAISFMSGFGDIFDKSANLYSVRAVCGQPNPGPRPTPTPERNAVASGDYDGDGAADIGIFRPENGLWVIRGLTRFYFGARGDIPVSGDYDGDGVCEAAIFRNTKGFWAVREATSFYLGGSGDLPLPGDYSGDGTTRGAIFRGKDGLWSIRAATRFFLGCAIDLPVSGDYNGDGTEDAALFRALNGQWAVRNFTRFYSGGPGDQAVRIDADGDGDDDAGIFRAAYGLWAIRGFPRYYLGISGDLPVPADYDGDGIDNRAVFRPSAGFWSVSGVTRAYCGTSDDLPLAR